MRGAIKRLGPRFHVAVLPSSFLRYSSSSPPLFFTFVFYAPLIFLAFRPFNGVEPIFSLSLPPYCPYLFPDFPDRFSIYFPYPFPYFPLYVPLSFPYLQFPPIATRRKSPAPRRKPPQSQKKRTRRGQRLRIV